MAENQPTTPPSEDYQAIAAEEKRKREAAEAQAQQYASQYQRDMQAIQQALIQAAQQSQQQQKPAPSPVEEDETWAMDPKKLASVIERVASEKAQQITEQALTPARNSYLRERITTNHKQCKAELEYFNRFEPEILQLMNQWGTQQGADIAASKDNWVSAYNLIVSNHKDEIIREEAKKLAARPPTDEGSEEEEQPISESPPQRQVPAAPPTPPVSQAHARASMRNQSTKPRPRLTPDQHFVSQTFGMTPEEYAQWQDPNYNPDPLA
jgi:hypothetical protein